MGWDYEKNYGERGVIEGIAKGEALVSTQPFGFFGGVDPSTGLVIHKWHELYGRTSRGRCWCTPRAG